MTRWLAMRVAQGSSAHAFYQPFVSTIASALGAVPDWRATDFWASTSFKQAWENFYKDRSRRAGEDPALTIRYISMCALFPPSHHLRHLCKCVHA